MALAIVQSGSVVDGGGGNFAFTVPSAVTVGNVILLCVGWDNNDGGTQPTATDTLGNSYAALVRTNPSGGQVTALSAIAAVVTTGGALSGTCAIGGQRGGGVALELSGVFGTLDQSAVVFGTTTSLITSGVVTTSSNEILVAIGATLGTGASTFAGDTNYTIKAQGPVSPSGQLAVETRIVGTKSSYTATYTNMTSGGFNSILLVTLPGAGGGGSGSSTGGSPQRLKPTQPLQRLNY